MAAVVVICVLVVGAAVFLARPDADSRPEPVDGAPNIVVIMADDQTLALMDQMPQTRELIVEPGTTFTTALASFPNCCPSRATYMTGQYAHNHGVRDNVAPHGGVTLFDQSTSIAVALQGAGYDTVHVGKYLNGFGALGDITPPKGWDRWFGLVDPTTYEYFGYTVSVDGVARTYGTAEADYQTDVLAAEAVDQIEARADGRPYFLSFTPLAPHVENEERAAGTRPGQGSGRFPMPVPPPRYATAFDDVDLPRSPAYDEEDVSDKPKAISERPRITDSSLDFLRRYETAELGALAALDDAVGEIMGALERTGQLDRTVVLFTSDNGLFHGEHRIVTGKFLLYDPAVRVPLSIRGPGFEPGREIHAPVGNVDLAPTIADLAGAALAVEPDGHSLADLDEESDDRAVLLQNFRGGEANSHGVRTERWAYLAHVDLSVELYDMVADPAQLENLAGRPEVADVQAALAETLVQLSDCSGSACIVEAPELARAP